MMFQGKKTYITAAVMALVTFARGMGWIDTQQYELIMGLLAALGISALRSGVEKK